MPSARVYTALVDSAALIVWLPPDGMTAPSGISPEDHHVGLASSLANLAAYLAR